MISFGFQVGFYFCNVIGLGAKLFSLFFFFANLGTDTGDLTFEQDVLFVFVLDSFSQGLDCGVFLLHHHDWFLPPFKEVLFAGDDFLHFSLGLFEDFSGFFSLLFLGDDLSSENVFLFLESFAFLIHGINEEILFFFDFLKIRDIIFGSESFDFSDGNIGLELNVVCLDFVVVSHEIFQLFLCFGDFAFENVHLLSFGVVDLIDLVEFLFGLDTETLGDVEIVVGFFVVHLVGCELLLGGVESNTDLFFVFLDVFLFDFGLLEF